MKQRLPDLVLVFVTIIWGSTFAITQRALQEIGPLGFVALRFAFGALALALFLNRRLKLVTRVEMLAGIGIGAILFAAYTLQTMGLQHTTSSKSAFITATYVPLVPICQLFLFGRKPSALAWVGAFVSFIGLGLLSMGDRLDLSFGLGEWLTLACAVASAFQIVLVGKYAPDADPIRLAAVQIATVAILALMTMPFAGEHIPALSGTLVAICLGMGVISTAFVLGAMNWAQQTVPATRATLIYALEPVWAGLVGAAIGERMGMAAMVGSALIVSGILVAELRIARTSPACG